MAHEYSDREVRVHYAMKANSNEIILDSLAKEGAWIDAVSPEEVELAVHSRFKPGKILFTGTSVSETDLRRVLASGARINIDSFSEMEKMRRLAPEYGIKNMKVSFRWDPGHGGAGFCWKTMTAGKEAHGNPIKFSIPADQIEHAYEKAVEYGFDPVGMSFHIGSNWRKDEEINDYFKVLDATMDKAKKITSIIGKDLEFVDFGGGPGIPYEQSHKEFPFDRYFKGTFERLRNSRLKTKAVAFEPGRCIVGDACVLLTQVNTLKERYGENFVGVDTGFNHLVRPAMYDSYHEIINCSKADSPADSTATVAGYLCETGDVLAKRRAMPKPNEGDILAIHNAGAYGRSMSSQYNSRTLPLEVSILDGKVIAITESIIESISMTPEAFEESR